MEEQVKLTCSACGAEVFRMPKPAPKNGREAKQSLFHCEYCGAVNLKDGTVRGKKEFTAQERPPEEKGGSVWKAILGIGITVISGIFLGKFIKNQQGNIGGSKGDPAAGARHPWDPLK